LKSLKPKAYIKLSSKPSQAKPKPNQAKLKQFVLNLSHVVVMRVCAVLCFARAILSWCPFT